MSKTYNWVVDAGSDSTRIFHIVDGNCEPVNAEGFTAHMQVRPYIDSKTVADELTTENGRIVIDTDGNVRVFLTHEATASYKFKEGVYDLELISPSGDVTRIVEGRVIVRKEVTRE